MTFSPVSYICSNDMSKEVSIYDIETIKKKALCSDTRRARILLHDGHEDKVQEMVIAICKDSYVPPHRQTNLEKTYYIQEGQLEILFFDENEIIKKILLGDDNKICRFNASVWHTVVAKTDLCVYSEVIAGPYKEGRTEFALWAPARKKHKEGLKFIENYLTRYHILESRNQAIMN